MEKCKRIIGLDEVYNSIREDDLEETREVGGANSKQEVDPSARERLFMAQRNPYALKDMQNFRVKAEKALEKLKDLTDEDMKDDENLPNVQFYQNNKPSTPDGVYIEDFHNNWFGKYDRLEYVHSYIQWLFPIQEKGMNYESHKLRLKEIKHFHQDPIMKKRILVSYKLMLDFYGIKLVDDETGAVTRAENWSDRFENLNRNVHNNLRITRILKCLGLLGFDHYQAPLVHFFLEETLGHGTLPQVKRSALDYFIFAVLDKTKQKELIEFACYCESKREFVGCPSDTFQNSKKTENYREIDSPISGWSGVSTSVSDQNNLIKSGEQNEKEILSAAKKDLSDNAALASESRKVENVFDVCQESDLQALPVLTLSNENTADANKDTEAPPSIYLQSVASDQKDDNKTKNIENSNAENFDANGNDNAALLERSKNQSDHNVINESSDKNPQISHDSLTEKAANKTSLSRILESEQQDRGDRADRGSNNELIVTTQHLDTESKEETRQCECESTADSVANRDSTNYKENSVDINSQKYTKPDENNKHNKLDTSKEEENEIIEDPVNRESSMEENPKGSVTDVCNNVPLNTDIISGSKGVRKKNSTDSEPDTAQRSGVNSSQGSHGDDSDEGKEIAVIEIGSVRGDKEENN